MPLKFAANLSWLFKETPCLRSRFALAKEAGFTAVECANPYSVPLEELVAAQTDSGLQLVLLNMHPGRPHDSQLNSSLKRLYLKVKIKY